MSGPSIYIQMSQASNLNGTEVGGGLANDYGVNVIHNGPPYDVDRFNAASFNVSIPSRQTYELRVEYAAQESRPVDVVINDTTIASGALAKPTGGWAIDHQQWSDIQTLTFDPGEYTITLQRNGVFPHIRTIALVPQ